MPDPSAGDRRSNPSDLLMVAAPTPSRNGAVEVGMDRLQSVGMRRRLAIACAAIAVAAASVGMVGVRDARGATTHRAAVVVEVNGVIHTAKITFTADSITGLDALRAAGFAPSVRVFGGNGGAVCALDVGGTTIGCPADGTCLTCSPASDYWAYWRALAGESKYTYSIAGAGTTQVRDGGVEAWNWSTGGAPSPFVSFTDVWGSDPPTTARPPATHASTTRAPATTVGAVGPLGSIPPSSSVPPSTAAPTSSSAAGASTTAAARHATTTVPVTTGARTADTEPGGKKLATAPVVSKRGGGSSWGLLGFAVILVLLVAAIVLARRRRRATPASP